MSMFTLLMDAPISPGSMTLAPSEMTVVAPVCGVAPLAEKLLTEELVKPMV